MVTIRVKNSSKQAKAFLELAKTLSFVEFIKTPYPTMDEIVDECRESRKEIAKKYNAKP